MATVCLGVEDFTKLRGRRLPWEKHLLTFSQAHPCSHLRPGGSQDHDELGTGTPQALTSKTEMAGVFRGKVYSTKRSTRVACSGVHVEGGKEGQ